MERECQICVHSQSGTCEERDQLEHVEDAQEVPTSNHESRRAENKMSYERKT